MHLLRRCRHRHFRMRAVIRRRTGLRQREQSGRHHGVGQRHSRRDTEAAADADGFAVHEAEIGHDGAGQREGRGFKKIALDHEHTDRAQHEAGEDRAAAHHFEPMIKHTLLRQR